MDVMDDKIDEILQILIKMYNTCNIIMLNKIMFLELYNLHYDCHEMDCKLFNKPKQNKTQSKQTENQN